MPASWSGATITYPGTTETDVTIAASITDTGYGLADTLNDDL